MFFKNILILFSIMFFVSCEKDITKSSEIYDDELIQFIIDAEKESIGISDLPSMSKNIISQEYNDYTEISVQKANSLGYQVSLDGKDYKPGYRNEVYFNLKGRMLISKRNKDSKNAYKCFELILPTTFEMPDGSSIIVEEESDYTLLRNWYKQNLNSKEMPILQYPVDIIYKDGKATTISNKEEMKNTILDCGKWNADKKDWSCFKLVYPIVYIMQDGTTISMSDEKDWEEIKSWYEINSDIKERPVLQYPVDIIYKGNQIQTINNDQELRTAQEECRE